MADGAFFESEPGVLSFHRLEPPDDTDVERLLLRIAHRINALIDATEVYDLDSAHAAAAHALRPPLVPVPATSPQPSRPRCAFLDGYSLHADLDVHQNDRRTLERLLRYGMRPPFSRRRLSLTRDGKVRLELRKPTFSGQTEIVLDPLDFLRRLVATIPPRGTNMTRYHGLFAPNANLRTARTALVPSSTKRPADAAHRCRGAADTAPMATDTDRPGPARYRRPAASASETRL